MFSKSNQDSGKNTSSEMEDLMNSNNRIEENQFRLESNEEQPEMVKLVEKISGILSPYFIVIVGLYLYDNNFFLGTVLIILGIVSLLKISYQDIWSWIENVISYFSKDQV